MAVGILYPDPGCIQVVRLDPDPTKTALTLEERGRKYENGLLVEYMDG